MNTKFIRSALLVLSLVFTAGIAPAQAETYIIDTKGAHAFVQFKIKHLGYSWLLGRFNSFEGNFELEENKPEASKISVTIDTKSVDTNHAERDKHLRSADFLEVEKWPTATFTSTKFEDLGNGKAMMHGDFTLKGITKSISFEVSHIGGGKDPWGGYRQGFEGRTEFAIADYGMMDLGPASAMVEI
ncbi:MAG: YceI family protein, partial [Sneathiella sp.]|nr:YceI family protein [Sneathiella sp.]